MNLPVLFAFASAAVAALFVLAAFFGKRNSLPLWSFCVGMLVLASEQLLSGLLLLDLDPDSATALIRLRFLATALLPGLWLLFAITFSRGKMMAALKRRWPFVALGFGGPLALVAFAPHALAIPKPDAAVEGTLLLGWSGFLLHVALMISMIGALVGLERTYRASVGTLRWKIKFMLYGMGTLFAARFFTSSQIILAQQIDPAMETVNAVALFVCSLLVARSVLRRGSFEIDLYPSQSIISGSLVITLAGTYLIIVGVLAKVVTAFGGDQAFAIQTFLILVALVGLGLVIQSDRARQLVRRFVSRNFQRPLFDYRTLWLKVTETTSRSVRRKDICQATTRLLANLFDTKLTSIWLLDSASSQFVLAASSDQKTNQSLKAESKKIDAGAIASELEAHPDPFDLDARQDHWVAPILESNPSAFDDGGNRILVPLAGQSAAVGFMVLGDRTNALRFTQQEFDTLRCIADHIAASLLSAALTRKLEQSKEIEAFQTMATFFVHDLKNAVSTLNLMLKNMPNHWDNPEFRQDALRGLGNTSQRITELITRLGQVRHELEISTRACDLSQLAEAAVAQWQPPQRVDFSQDLAPSLPVEADAEKLQSVILNFLINATEAMDGGGALTLSAYAQGNHAYLSVQDTGSGMSEAFVRDSLFRPFKTTKKGGLGIGMFQSKMVVEAHGGSIQVESAEGEGSTFTLRLPLREPPKA